MSEFFQDQTAEAEPDEDETSAVVEFVHEAFVALVVLVFFFGCIAAHGALLIFTSDDDGLTWVKNAEFFYSSAALFGVALRLRPAATLPGVSPSRKPTQEAPA